MEDDTVVRVEVVDVSYYLAKPLPVQAVKALPEGPCYERARQVPVVRVFGATPEGPKCCLHVHGVFPYFYMRCENDPAFDDVATLMELLPTIGRDLEAALRSMATAPETDAQKAKTKPSKPIPPSIAKLVIVKGIPFYGYHATEVFFVKVFFYDPAKTSRIVQAVESGHVAARMFADYHIEGMNYLRVRDATFRTQTGTSTDWPVRQSNCAIEADVSCKNILNPQFVNLDSDACYVPSLAPLWEEEKQRRRDQGLAATPEAAPSIPRDALRRRHSEPDGSPSQSPLSQSHFNTRMWASLNEIIRQAASKHGNSEMLSNDGSESPFPAGLDDSNFAYSQLDHAPKDDEADASDELLRLLSRLQEDRLREAVAPPSSPDAASDDEADDDHTDEAAAEERNAQAILDSQRDFELQSSQDVLPLEECEKPTTAPAWWERDQSICESQCSVDELGAPRILSPDRAASQAAASFAAADISPLSQSHGGRRYTWRYTVPAPKLDDLLPLPPSATPSVFYSNAADVPDKPVVYAGQRYAFPKPGVEHLPEFPSTHRALAALKPPAPSTRIRRRRTPLRLPPTWQELQATTGPASMPSPPTPTPAPVARPAHLHISNLTLLSVEVHASSRGELLPDPSFDAVEAIAMVVDTTFQQLQTRRYSLLVLDAALALTPLRLHGHDYAVEYVPTERALLERFVERVAEWDPDFLVGFEIQVATYGYLIDRGAQLDPPINLIETLSRLPHTRMDSRNQALAEGNVGAAHGMKKAAGIWIYGRHILNVWRCARSELKLARYTFEAVVAHVLKRRFPKHAPATLSAWFIAGGSQRLRTLEHVGERADVTLQLVDRLQLVTRTSEMARLFGIDFFSVLSRGSQYRVEAVNIRVTKRLNYIMVSASRAQVAAQPPMEIIPLVMEPLSSFYAEPVVVLDFQSLYPSMVIAYNLCYSTFIGRLVNGLDPALETVLGVVADHRPNVDALRAAGGDTIVTPNGALFCPKAHRLGVLPRVLDEILSTRIMIKQAMKQTTDKRLVKVLDARQLALKMIANVTYGYTAASFSGRMPCAQLADAIVHSGRVTLEAAVRLVESHPTWHARVVYGDTDSLFVQLRGRSLRDAWAIGQEIATAVTAANPKPVCLKLEKVYMGSFLVSKKRYVGLKFEGPDEVKGVLDAKGIETVRRDSCGVVQKPMRRWLELMFTKRDVSKGKAYLQQYWQNMHHQRIPLRDFIFAKEVRLGTYAGQGPPAVLVATKAMAKDPRAEPRYAERVAYVVVRGPPGARLMDLVVPPEELACHDKYTLNVDYYVTKQMLPSLERLALLMGVNVRQWYLELPRVVEKALPSLGASSVMRIDAYYASQHCVLCGALNSRPRRLADGGWLCPACKHEPQKSFLLLQNYKSGLERQLLAARSTCAQCMGSTSHDADWTERRHMVCVNDDCDVWNRWLRGAALLEACGDPMQLTANSHEDG
ncbi:hypothetical protein ACHHYP_12413 [Achlya hypogyna]|uniref:DNA polymerase n=1 Tax=Achlya hypogyna TaxID=1202772 RepID=A0A1V9YH72_ACHHY|nr:hypothetical protein ACHHYP_12413 [Achlya hypogyna]